MIYYNSCRKCGGSVELRNELYGRALKCLACGWRLDEVTAGPKADRNQAMRLGLDHDRMVMPHVSAYEG